MKRLPDVTLQRLKLLYPKQSQRFLEERFQKAGSLYKIWRAFPPYFTQLADRLEFVGFSDRRGFCAGDAHPENFGYLFSGEPVFSLNDLDDAAPGALDVDAMRLLIGLRFVCAVSAKEFLESYNSGLSGKSPMSVPEYVRELFAESAEKKFTMKKKYRKLLDSREYCEDFTPVKEEDAKLIDEYVNREKLKPLFVCEMEKDTGGSAGAKRFVFFTKTASGTSAFELKELHPPAPVYSELVTPEERIRYLLTGVETFFGKDFIGDYQAIVLGKFLFQRRPIYGGNVGVELKDIPPRELKDVLLFEAHALGELHRRTNSSSVAGSPDEWEEIARRIEKSFTEDFS